MARGSWLAARPALVAALVAFLVAATAGIGLSAERATQAEAALPTQDGSVNMEFRDTELGTVLRTLCRGAGLDFVLDPSVKGRVTAKLRNTSWDRALEIILASHDLESKRTANTLVITRARPAADGAADARAKRVVVTPRPDGTFDLDASGADIHDAFRELAIATKMNIVTAKEVTGTVTASLRGLPRDEILTALADCCDAVVVTTGKVSRITTRPPEPPPVAPAPLPKEPPVEVRRLDGGLLALHVRDADIRKLLAELAAAADMNIVAAPSVSGTVSLDLHKVTAEDVLAALAVHSGLVFKPVGSLLFAERVPAPIDTETFRLRYADAKQLAEALKDKIEGAKIGFEAATNVLIVSGTREAIAAVARVVEKVEATPLLISIEARLFETNFTGDEKLGIDWSDSIRIDATTPELLHTWPVKYKKTVSPSSYFPSFDPTDARSRYYVDPKGLLPPVPFVTPHAKTDDFKFGVLSSSGLSAVLHMLQTKTKTTMLANPTVSTLENVEATINDVTKFPIATYTFSKDTGIAVITGFDYEEFGTILKVTPRVIDGHIIMDVRPEVSRQAGETVFQNAVLPIIRSQYAEATVRIKDGDTLVIAGLIREDTQNKSEGIPLLSRIPLLGPLLFGTRQSKVDARRNLLIFITPHIVKQQDFDAAARLKKRRTEPLPKFGDDEEKKP